MFSVLVVDDSTQLAEIYGGIAARAINCQLTTASVAGDALELVRRHQFDVIVTDLRMHGRLRGLEILREAKIRDELTQVIVVTSWGDPRMAVEAMSMGAFDYLSRANTSVDVLEVLPFKLRLAGLMRRLLLDARGRA